VGVCVRPVNRQAKRENSPGERMRVLAVATAILWVTGLSALGLALATGASTWWALAGFGLIGGVGFSLGTRAQIEVVRQSAPADVLTGRDLARYAVIALGLAALVAAVAGIGAAA
jgi:hypothetical protein